jgi:hypothetical protein
MAAIAVRRWLARPGMPSPRLIRPGLTSKPGPGGLPGDGVSVLGASGSGVLSRLMSWKASFCPLAGQLSGGHAKLKHARGELEAAFHSAGIPHLLQREQDAPGGGTGQPGRGRHRGQRHDRLARLERPDHVEATGKGLDEVRAGVAACHRASSARGWCARLGHWSAGGWVLRSAPG